MGREKRAAQSRAQELLEKTGRNSDVAAGAPESAPSPAAPQDKPATTTRKAIVEIVLLYLIPILLIIVVGKLVLKL
ncbi:MAG: hypothetical protein ABIK89_08965 [Planctomycetota bacterium]